MIGRRRSRLSRVDDAAMPPGGEPRAVGPNASEAELWAATQAGSTEAFGTLFDRHADTVYRYAMVRLRHAPSAEEVVSVVFGEAWRQRSHVELRDGSLRPWLLGVARNQVSRAARQQARQLRRDQAVPATAAADHAAAVAAGVDAARDLTRVLDALDQLAPESRETLVLHVWGELSHEQIAQELGVSVGTVKSRIHRARSRLAAALDDEATPGPHRPTRTIGDAAARPSPAPTARVAPGPPVASGGPVRPTATVDRGGR